MAGSIKSQFQLLSYKMDKVSLDVVQTMGVLASNFPATVQETDFSIRARNPFRFSDNGSVLYVNGINVSLKIRSGEQVIATGEFTITGLFESSGFDDKLIEERIVKVQAPAILFPYMRACITNVLASAGFGSVILPLINVVNLMSSADIVIEDKGELRK